jgi:hypothetical protein
MLGSSGRAVLVECFELERHFNELSHVFPPLSTLGRAAYRTPDPGSRVLCSTSPTGDATTARLAHTPIVSAAVKPADTEPDIVASWWIPPSSPNTLSLARLTCETLRTLCSYPLVA